MILGYKPTPDLFEKHPRFFTAQEAKENFNWVMSIKEERAKHIKELTGVIGMPFQDALVQIWRWYREHFEMRDCTPQEIELREKSLILFAYKRLLTDESLWLARDIGIFIGEQIVAMSDDIRWCYFTKPKSAGSWNFPSLSGFSAPFSPLMVSQGQAKRLQNVLEGASQRECKDADLLIAINDCLKKRPEYAPKSEMTSTHKYHLRFS